MVHSPTGPYAWLVLSSISSLGDTSSQTGPTGCAVGPTLACPLAAREYIAFLREQRCITTSPVRNPRMAATKKVIITLIAATTPMDREVAVGPVKSMYYGITNHNSHSSTHIIDGLHLQLVTHT